MGCSDSKEKRAPSRPVPTPTNNGPIVPPIAGADRRVIGATAQGILDNSVQFRTLVETVQPLGFHANAQQLMADGRSASEYFRGGRVPSEVAGVADSSFVQLINTMKLSCQTECIGALTANLQKQGTYLDEAQSAKYGRNVAAESSKAIHQMTEQYVTSVFERSRLEASATGPAAPAAGGNKPRGGTSATPPRRSPRMSPSNNANSGGAAEVVLPAGKWTRAENSAFYWSDEEKLFYHPDSAQFFDPETNKWYDPENDEWYDDEGEN